MHYYGVSFADQNKRLTSYHFMDNENEQPQVEPEEVVAEETTEETVETPEETPEEETVTLKKSDYNKLNHKAIAYDTIKKSPIKTSNPDSIDLIKLGKKLQDYSDEELDFVTEFAKSKKPEDILKALDNQFVKQGIISFREKVEKEKLTLKPSSTQSESDRPKTLHERLTNASIEEKEKILMEIGAYKSPRPKGERQNIGAGMRY